MDCEKFTAGKISAYQCKEGRGRSIYWDAETTNLGLRVTKAENKAYIFESSLKGKTIRVTIGALKDWTIKDARIEAAAYHGNRSST